LRDTLHDLEQRRSEFYERLAGTGDFRRGSLTANYRKCGKSNCSCAQPDHPGHGPRHLLTRSVAGKTEARQVSAGPEMDKVRRELANYKRFTALAEEIVETNERICDARPLIAAAEPVPEAVAGDEKKGSSRTSGRSSRRR